MPEGPEMTISNGAISGFFNSKSISAIILILHLISAGD
jgi:hypothetical protein